MTQVTICKECKFAEEERSKATGIERHKPNGVCLSPDAPIHDYITGESHCRKINSGNCKFFKPYAGNSNKGDNA